MAKRNSQSDHHRNHHHHRQRQQEQEHRYQARQRMTHRLFNAAVRCLLLAIPYYIIVPAWAFTSSAGNTFSARRLPTTTKTITATIVRRHAHALNTAFEWLALDRACFTGDGLAQPSIQWIDPASAAITVRDGAHDDAADDGNECFDNVNNNGSRGDDNTTMTSMPLYPLNACYLPVPSTIHTLNNVEPRNIRMALDLMGSTTAPKENDDNDDGQSSVSSLQQQQGSCFCVVLRAADTGRIASVGTVMRLIEAEPKYNPTSGEILRITVKCCAEEIVNIVSIDNPHAATRESRLFRSPNEYLVAKVCRSRCANDDDDDDKEIIMAEQRQQQLAMELIENYSAVRAMYVQEGRVDDDSDGNISSSQGDVGGMYNAAQDLPPFARDQFLVSNALPLLTPQDVLLSDSNFWRLAQAWQTLCSTVREGRQINLSADVNEIMIDEAFKNRKGGPLKLPVHLEDLPPEARSRVKELEMEAQQEYVQLGLDPCLDFQALLSSSSSSKRLELLSRMIARERQRLENESIRASSSTRPKKKGEQNEQPRKGAWFEGFD